MPESVNDLEAVVHTLMQDLITNIFPHHMEIDRAHRALTAPRSDDHPRDVIVKPYYKIKEKMMAEARGRGDISLLGHSVQLFADISQLTIQKRRSLKPLLTHLMNRHIKYRWSFPFQLSFTYKGKTHSFVNFQDKEGILLELGLISRDSSSTSPQRKDRPISSIWSQQGRSSSSKRPSISAGKSTSTVCTWLD